MAYVYVGLNGLVVVVDSRTLDLFAVGVSDCARVGIHLESTGL